MVKNAKVPICLVLTASAMIPPIYRTNEDWSNFKVSIENGQIGNATNSLDVFGAEVANHFEMIQ